MVGGIKAEFILKLKGGEIDERQVKVYVDEAA